MVKKRWQTTAAAGPLAYDRNVERSPEPRRTVLVVEDERNIRDLVCLHLGVEGLTCVAAASGTEAMEYARSRPFDLR